MLPLLSRSGNGRQRRASVLLLAAVLLLVASVGAGLPAGFKCHHIDCAKEGRHLCKPGSSHCGPCISPLQENEEGLCVARRHHQHAPLYQELDEEIDYLQSVIEKQEVSEATSPKKESKHPAPVISQSHVRKSKTEPSKHKQKSPAHPSTGGLNNFTTAPGPVVSVLTTTQSPKSGAAGVAGRVGPIAIPAPTNDRVIVIIVSLCVAVGMVAVIMATVCYIKLQRESRLAQKVDYPAFGGASAPAATETGTAMGDKTLAQSAQMFHYQHQKQQMLSMGNHKPDQKVADTDVTSDEEEVGGDFTVYECPGLAPTGEMEVKNPLFDDSTIHYQGNHK